MTHDTRFGRQPLKKSPTLNGTTTTEKPKIGFLKGVATVLMGSCGLLMFASLITSNLGDDTDIAGVKEAKKVSLHSQVETDKLLAGFKEPCAKVTDLDSLEMHITMGHIFVGMLEKRLGLV